MNKNRFYVYLHHRKDNGEVFYIGKGQRSRSTDRHNRGKKWRSTVESAGGFTVSYVAVELTNDAALQLENSLIRNPNPNWNLVNQIQSPSKVLLRDFELDKYFYYDETSPSCLRWKLSTSFKIKKDAPAGSQFKNKRWAVNFKGKTLYVYRIIAELFNLNTAGLIVDHIDGDCSNNRISNLRIVTVSQNLRNTSKKSNNKSGVAGVSYCKSNNSWRVTCYLGNGERVYKTFYCKKLGHDEAFRLACEFRNNTIEDINKVDVAYSERHGT